MTDDANSIDPNSLTAMATTIVANYVSGNKVAQGDLPQRISSVFGALRAIETPTAEVQTFAVERPTPAQIRKSITPEALISFEDGKAYKTLKRHLSTFGLSIAEYKAKWSLPVDYPVTAPAYSARRSEMAKSLGLGRKAGSSKAKPAAKKKATRKA